MNKILKNKSGITLIALVITIIMLIILAGVSISVLVGENGIITKALSAKEKHEIAKITEELEIYKSTVAMDNYLNVPLDKYLEYIDNIGDKGLYDIGFVERVDETQAYILVNGKYKYLLKEEENGNLLIIYEGIAENLLTKLQGVEVEYQLSTEELVNTNVTTKIIIHTNKDITKYVIQYTQVDKLLTNDELKNQVWTNYTDEGIISTNNEIIYSRLLDGEKDTTYTYKEINNIDKNPPELGLKFNTVSSSTDSPIIAEYKIEDKGLGVDIDKCKWTLNTDETKIGADASKYENAFTELEGKLTLNSNKTGKHYLHILLTDNVNNVDEIILTITYQNPEYEFIDAKTIPHSSHSANSGSCYRGNPCGRAMSWNSYADEWYCGTCGTLKAGWGDGSTPHCGNTVSYSLICNLASIGTIKMEESSNTGITKLKIVTNNTSGYLQITNYNWTTENGAFTKITNDQIDLNSNGTYNCTVTYRDTKANRTGSVQFTYTVGAEWVNAANQYLLHLHTNSSGSCYKVTQTCGRPMSWNSYAEEWYCSNGHPTVLKAGWGDGSTPSCGGVLKTALDCNIQSIGIGVIQISSNTGTTKLRALTSATSDYLSNIISYKWSSKDGSFTNMAENEINVNSAGTYECTITYTDTKSNRTASKVISYTVK